MRGKKPKEREKYVIRLGDGTLVEVNREIYLEWYRSERRERYQKERDRKYGLCSIDKLHEKGYFPKQSICTEDTTQEAVLRNECQSRLQNALKNLPEQAETDFRENKENDGRNVNILMERRSV